MDPGLAADEGMRCFCLFFAFEMGRHERAALWMACPTAHPESCEECP